MDSHVLWFNLDTMLSLESGFMDVDPFLPMPTAPS